MADANTPPKDMEVRLTELENAVTALTQSLQGTLTAAGTQATAQIPTICSSCTVCSVCYHCYICNICTTCRPICNICRPICAECNGCQAF